MRKASIPGLIIIALIVAAFLVGIFVFGPESNNVEELEDVEVSEYEGQNLSSINDFRENSIKGPQYVDIDNYQLQVTGLAETPTNFTYDDVIEDFDNYKKVVMLNCVEGWAVNILWEGILVRDILEQVVPMPEANTIIFHAYDGYTTSFPLEYVLENDIIIAHKMNDVTLPPERGFPFQLVAESKWGYKWIKWITQIELSDDADYEGFWESLGYSNEGDLNKGYFD